MKLAQYMANLNKFAKKNPQALEMNVVTSMDDEGNGYNNIHFTPTIGTMEDGEFHTDKEEKDTVCVN